MHFDAPRWGGRFRSPLAGLFPAVSVGRENSSNCRAALDLIKRRKARPSRAAPLECLKNSPLCSLEVQLQRELHQSRVAGPLDAAKVGAIGCIAIRLEELCMVKHVEDFGPELHAITLADAGLLQHGQLRVKGSRPAADRPRCVTDRAELHGIGIPNTRRVGAIRSAAIE